MNRHSINHFYEKLLKLKDTINTAEAKKIAEKRTIYMEEYLKEFFDEWDGKK
ncbi:putative hydrolase [compost metagenome]